MKSRLSFAVLICTIALALLSFTAAAPAACAQIQVLSADPPAAEQGMVNLNVVIKGKGFKRGAIARFWVTRTTNPGGIRVNSTAFNSSAQLTANIDIAPDAVLGLFDIEVQNSDGRTGKGIEMFTVQTAGSSNTVSLEATLGDLPGDKIRSDGAGPYPMQDLSINWQGFNIFANDGRVVEFQFDDPPHTFPAQLTCTYFDGKSRLFPTPYYLLSLEKIFRPDRTQMTTYYELIYDAQNGVWVPVIEGYNQFGPVYKLLRPLSMAPGETRYAELYIEFHIAVYNDTFYLDYYRIGHGGTGDRNVGVMKVRADPANIGAANDKWYLSPITQNISTGWAPNEAHHWVNEYKDSGKDVSGNCGLGNFIMPFSLTVTRTK